MATGRIGVTPVLRTRWSKLPTTGTTVLSGLDDNSVALVYDAGYEAVYRNGVLLSRGNDYTATNGTTVTLIDATLATDIIEIFANDLVPLTDAISKGQYNAKGALLSATAASTPAVLPVGSNAQVLTADSTASTGLAWATASAGGLTQLATGSLSGGSVSLTSISGSYKHLELVITGMSSTSNSNLGIQYNSITTNTYSTGSLFVDITSGGALTNDAGTNRWYPTPSISSGSARTDYNAVITFWNYAVSGSMRIFEASAGIANSTPLFRAYKSIGYQEGNGAITSLDILASGGTFDAGIYTLYGVS